MLHEIPWWQVKRVGESTAGKSRRLDEKGAGTGTHCFYTAVHRMVHSHGDGLRGRGQQPGVLWSRVLVPEAVLPAPGEGHSDISEPCYLRCVKTEGRLASGEG